MKHSAEYLRKRTMVRRLFWTPVSLAIFAWVGWVFVQALAN